MRKKFLDPVIQNKDTIQINFTIDSIALQEWIIILVVYYNKFENKMYAVEKIVFLFEAWLIILFI